MLQQLHLQNFQSHKDTTIELSPYLTIFVGLNNHGKSAIFRGLRKVIRDTPEGVTFISDWSSSTAITAVTDTGHSVSREVYRAGKGSHTYVVDGVPFVKFKKTPTDEILGALDISPVQVFGDESIDLNFQNQLDAPFLVSGPGLPSLRGKVLGKATGIDIAQRALQLAAASERSHRQDLKQNTEEASRLQIEIAAYDDMLSRISCTGEQAQKRGEEVQERLTFIGILEGAHSRRVDIRERAAAKVALLKKLPKEFPVAESVQLTKIIPVLERALDLQKRLQVKISMLEDLVASFDSFDTTDAQQWDGIVQRLETCQYLGDALSRVSLLSLPSEVDEMLRRCTKTEVLQATYQLCTNLVSQITAKETAYDDACRREEAIVEEMQKLKKEIQICPLCERPFDE